MTARELFERLELPVGIELPTFDGATAWLNTTPLTPEDLHDKVVLVDFWTYTCVNWLRTLPYLRANAPWGLDVDLAVEWNGEVVSRPPYRTMYWSPAQMLAHLTVNGASTRPGDLFASGTISGPEPETRGSFLELSWGGKEPFADGRTFLEDGDEVALRYSAPGTGGGRITLGEVAGRIEPARP